MPRHVYLHDSRDFGTVGFPHRRDPFALHYAYAIVEHFIHYHQPWGGPTLDDYSERLGYLMTIMEGVDGFDQLTDERQDWYLTSSVEYLDNLITHLEKHHGDGPNHVNLYPTHATPRLIALYA